MKKHLGWAIRMLIAAAGIGFILYTLDWTTHIAIPDEESVAVHAVDRDWVTPARPLDASWGLVAEDGRIARADLETIDENQPQFKPSFVLVIRESRWPMLLGGLAIFSPVFLIGAARWTLLMRARGIDARFGRTFRLTMAGQFFNLCMPGTTGGDVMKAFYVTKGTDQRADAVISVAVDRVCGLVGLILLVGVVGLFSLDDPLIRRLTITMWIGLASLIAIASVYASKTIRARLRLGAIIGKVPGAGVLRNLDALVAAYRNHVGALLGAIALSLPVHLCLALAMTMAGYALGVDQPLVYMLVSVPIVLLLWSLPVSGPLGLGPLDYVAMQLIIGSSGTTAQQALVMFVAYRMYAVAIGLAGASALLGSDAPSSKVQAEPGSDSPTQTTRV